MMRESTIINAWLDEGRQEGELRKGRADILRVLGKRLGTPVPEPIRLAIEGTNDTTILDRWLDAAIDVASYADFQTSMRQP